MDKQIIINSTINNYIQIHPIYPFVISSLNRRNLFDSQLSISNGMIRHQQNCYFKSVKIGSTRATKESNKLEVKYQRSTLILPLPFRSKLAELLLSNQGTQSSHNGGRSNTCVYDGKQDNLSLKRRSERQFWDDFRLRK